MGGCASSGPTVPATYVVRAQDTLYGIAWRHNLDYRDLAKWNGLKGDLQLSVGQVLVLEPAERPYAPKSAVPPQLPPPQLLPPHTAVHAPEAPHVGKPVALKDDAAAAPVQHGDVPAAKSPPAAGAPPAAAVASVAGPSKWVWPTDRVSPPRPVPGGGILLLGRLGQDVRAAGAGRVVYTGSGLRGYGNLIIIKHGETLLSSYAHNREMLVHEGQDVAAGQLIARMGMGPHQISALYFEIRVNGRPADPLRYLAAER